VIFLHPGGPPSSAPMTGLFLRHIISPIVQSAKQQNTTTEKPKVPGLTTNCSPFAALTIAANDQASPMPRYTLTEFDPVTFPTDESAVSS
jgi:hypothetical protein